MVQRPRNFGLVGLVWLWLVYLIALGCSPSLEESAVRETQNQKKAETPPLPYQQLLGRWQSACNLHHFGEPAITSIDFRASLILWSNHFYRDKACSRVDRVENYEYDMTYLHDIKILATIDVHLFQLTDRLGDADLPATTRLELFRAQDGWLYISDPSSGPEFDTPWKLASNFGLRFLEAP